MSSSDDNDGCGCAIWIVAVCVIIILACMFGVTNPAAAERALTAQNFTDIKMTGYRWFAGTGDWYHTGFEATAPNGSRVTGVVGSGLFFKGSTVRLD